MNNPAHEAPRTKDETMETTTVRLVDGAVVKAIVVKRTAKRVSVKVPVILYGVVSWDAMSVPTDRADVVGEPCNLDKFNRATAPDAAAIEAALFLA